MYLPSNLSVVIDAFLHCFCLQKFGVTVRSPIDHAVPKGILELYNRPDFWVLSGDKLHHNHEEKVSGCIVM